jgi:signal transduction histidine kinase
MARPSIRIERVLRSRDLRILSVMVAGIAVFGVIDGSLWRGLLTPTIAYRPAILFGLMLVFGWRGFVWSQLLFFISFLAFLGWRGGVFVAPLFLISNACAFVVARRLARSEPWLLRQRSTLAFLAGAVLAPAVPALLNSIILDVVGIPLRAGVLSMVDSWLRVGAGILALAPAVLVYLSGPLKVWTALDAESEWQPTITTRDVLGLAVEVVVWTATFWISVKFKVHYGLNVSYLTFLPPLAFTLFRSMRLAVLALAANAVIATTLWYQLHWEQALSAGDLRLLIAIYSLTILVLAAVVDERQRDRGQVEKLRTAEGALRESEGYLKNATRLARVGYWQWDIEANHVSGSEEMFRIFGKPPGFTPSFDDFLQTVIPQDRERVARWVGDSLAEKRGSEIEYQIAWRNGDLRTVLCVSEISLGEEGLPMRMFGACQDITDVKKNEAKIVQAQEDLRALTARLVEVQELSTKELARELHDDLSQNLTALGREIETLLPPSAQPSRSLSIWRRIMKLARDVHSMSQRLHPTILDDLGLKEALKEQCWVFSERTGIPVLFEFAGESTRPAADVSLCFYRVAQEGLHNIAKHAGATSVHLTLSSSEENCSLRIEDNGQGFDPSEARRKNALGLISMRERARLVNGNFRIRSEYGKGTMLEVSVALKTN